LFAGNLVAIKLILPSSHSEGTRVSTSPLNSSNVTYVELASR